VDDKNERFQLITPASVLERVKELAQKERRSISNMIVVLLIEAMGARESKKGSEKGNSRPATLTALTPNVAGG
jgi:hypothetical protein